MFRANTQRISILLTNFDRQWCQKKVGRDLLLFKFVDLELDKRRHVWTEVSAPSAANSKMSVNGIEANMFKLSDYDCIGFDLDNTILRYNVTNMVQLEYEVLSKYLVEEKGRSAEYLLKPLDKLDIDFFKKGLLLDFSHGNVIQIARDGQVLQASHGTRFLTDKEIDEYYGPDRMWPVTKEFTDNMLEAWNGPVSNKVRTLLDYFDMPSSLAFARIVDSLDAKNGGKLVTYEVWPDVLDGVINMFNREHFELNKGGYFPALKANPDKYLHKCSNSVIDWLKQLKKSKKVFLVTGSNVDFGTFTARYCLGEDWRNLFDVVVTYARKPGFFTGERPFLKLDGITETDEVKGSDLKLEGSIYSQGNWQELYKLFANETNQTHPKCLYFGDNLVQDIYTPAEFTNCDVVAVVEELTAEERVNYNSNHPDTPVITSKSWGSYFYSKNNNNSRNSIWDDVVRTYSKICIPDLDAIASLPLDHKFKSFNGNSIERAISENKQDGYYPSPPISCGTQ